MKKFLLTVLAIAAILFFSVSCVSSDHPQISAYDEEIQYPASSYIPQDFNWEQVAPGISRFDFQNKEFPIIYHAVRIDLTQPGLQLVCFPDSSTIVSNNDELSQSIEQPFIFKGIRTQKFAKKYDCTIALNASPFGGKNGTADILVKLGSTRQITGIHKVNGIIISKPVRKYAQICFNQKEQSDGTVSWSAKIESSQTTENIAGWDYAFGGFYTILEQGNVRDFPARNHDSRSGAGLSQDGKYLYLLVAEGEYPSKSEGLSYNQCGEIFKEMGCYDAMELDGGGSSELCINGKSILTYKNFRYQANSFGFKLN